MLDELRAKGIDLDVDALRARLRSLCAEYGVEEDRPDVMRAELVRRLGEDGWIERWSRADDKLDRNPFERLREPARRLLERLQDRGMVVGLGVLATAVVVVAIVLLLPNDPPNPGPSSNRYVIDPDEMTNARGVVKYCTGADADSLRDSPRPTDVDMFNEKYESDGLSIKLVPLGSDVTQELERFQSYQRKGVDKCDVLLSDVIWTADFVHNHWLVDLSRYRKERRPQDDFVPTMEKAATIDGKTWAIPKQANGGLLYYRKDRVRRAPTTWQELYVQARAGSKRRFRYQGLAYEGLTVDFLEIALAAGARDIVTPEGRANIDQEPALQALQFMVDGIRRAAPHEVVDQNEAKNEAAFGSGKPDFMRNWPSSKRALLDNNPGLAGKVATAPLPRWRGGGRGSVLGGNMLVIPRLSKNRGAALRAVHFLSSRQVMKRDATESFIAPALRDLWDDPEVKRRLPSHAALKREIFQATLRPLVPNYEAVSRAIYTNVNRALRGTIEPRVALGLANDQMDEALAVFRQHLERLR
jgi:multiple sugar transport system substrate-binding protein